MEELTEREKEILRNAAIIASNSRLAEGLARGVTSGTDYAATCLNIALEQESLLLAKRRHITKDRKKMKADH